MVSIGTANLSTFTQFLLDNNYAHKDQNGNIVTNPLTLDELDEIHTKFEEFLLYPSV